MARGQAFETMMLVISVIVALAILAVLLNILNIANLFPTGTSDPTSVMTKGLKDVVSRGYFVSTPQEVSFKKGSMILRGSVIQGIPDITSDEVNFYCAEGNDDACNNAFETSETKFSVKKEISMYVVVCGDVNRPDNPKYCIAISRQEGSATDTCIEECGME